MAPTRSRPRGREHARPSSGGVAAEHATKIYTVAIVGIVVIIAFLALTSVGHVIDAATQHFMLFYAGVFALIGLCASVVLGLVATDRMFLNPGHRVFIQSAHRAASFGAVTFLIIHIITEILAQRVHVLDAVIPFLSPFRTFYIGLGTIASDLVILLVITGIMRGRFNASGKAWRWRAIHYTSYASFVFGVWHGLLGGRPGKPYVDWSYGFLVAFVLLGLAVRVLSNSLRPKENLSAPPVDRSRQARRPPRCAPRPCSLSSPRRAANSYGPERRHRRPAVLSAPRTYRPARRPARGRPRASRTTSPVTRGRQRYLGAPRATGYRAHAAGRHRADAARVTHWADAAGGHRAACRRAQERPAAAGADRSVARGGYRAAAAVRERPDAAGPTGPLPRAGYWSDAAGRRAARCRAPDRPVADDRDGSAAAVRRAARCRCPGRADAAHASRPDAAYPAGRCRVTRAGRCRSATGPMPRTRPASAAVRERPDAAGPDRPAAGGGHRSLPPYASGPMPHVPNGPGTGPRPQFRPATGPMPRAATGPLPQAGDGRPAAWDAGHAAPPPGGPMPRAADGPRWRGGTGPRPQDGLARGRPPGRCRRPAGPCRRPRPCHGSGGWPAGQGWQAAGHDGSRYPAEPPWDGAARDRPQPQVPRARPWHARLPGIP